MTWREEIIGEARLILGDCREVMPTLAPVDAVVTDPPYGLGLWNNRGTNAGGPFDSTRTAEWDVAISGDDVRAMMAASRYQIFWGCNYYLDHLPRSKHMLVWNKGIRGMHYNDCEIAWCSQWKQACRIFDLTPHGLEKLHPTQKPLALMQWCVGRLPDDAKTILDPFTGAGTTGVACAMLGRRFIGIEIDPTYFDIACKRIESAYRQPRLFKDERVKIKQVPML